RKLERQGKKVDLVIMVGSTGWNTHFRLLHVLVSAIGFFLRMTPAERARLFLASRDRLTHVHSLYRYSLDRLKEVAEFSPGEQISWLRSLIKQVTLRVMQTISHNTAVDSIGPQYSTPLGGPYRTQLGGYVPGRYSGRVELFWADYECARHPFSPLLRWKELADGTLAWGRVAKAFEVLRWNKLADPTLGWGRVAKALRVHVLPGVTNTSITTDVKVLAEQMKACLEEVQASK